MKDQKLFDDTLYKIRNNQVNNPLDLQRQDLLDCDIFLLNEALAQKKSITELILWRNEIGDEGATALAKNNALTSLNLGFNVIGDEGAQALANKYILTSLNLTYNHIGDEGAMALAQNNSLTELNLRFNIIGNEGAMALATNHSIALLDLRGNQIGDMGATALAQNHFLTSLNLWDNEIGDKGATALAKNHFLSSLDLRGNVIGDEGAMALAQNNSLTSLDLRANKIGPVGSAALAQNNSITELNLGDNNIGREAHKTITTMLKRNRKNARNFLQASLVGNLQLLQSMLNDNLVSPYCCVRRYNDTNSDYLTALHVAVIGSHHDIARWLVKNYPQLLRMADKDNKTPLMLAKEKNDTTMSAILSGKKEEQYTVRYTFSPDKEMHQNSLKQLAVFEGDSLTSLEKIPVHVGWLRCQNNKGEQGYVPVNFLKKVTLQSSSAPSMKRTSSTSSSVFSSSPVSQLRGAFMINGAPRQVIGSQYEVDPLKSLNL